MTKPTEPDFRDHLDRPVTSVQVTGESHTPTITDLEYNLKYEVDETEDFSCGALDVIHTGVPVEGEVLLIFPNHVIHHSTAASVEQLWNYHRRGTSLDETILNEPHPFIKAAYQAATMFDITKAGDYTYDVAPGNASAGGVDVPEVSYDGSEGNSIEDDASDITAGKWCKVGLSIVPDGEGSGDLVTECSESSATELLAKASLVAVIPNGMPIGHIIHRKDSALNAASIYPYYGRAYGGGTVDLSGEYDQDGTLTRGDCVCLSKAVSGQVDKSNSDEDDFMPAIGFVSEVITASRVRVQCSGAFEFFEGDTNYGALAIEDLGATAYVSSLPGQVWLDSWFNSPWAQSMGEVLEANVLYIVVGEAAKDNDTYNCDAGLLIGMFACREGNFAFPCNYTLPDTDMPAYGIVISKPSPILCVIKNNFVWRIADFGDARPKGVTAGVIGDKWWAADGGYAQDTEPSVAGQGREMVCRQHDAGGDAFLIDCQHSNWDIIAKEGYIECHTSVQEEDAVYLMTGTNVAYPAIADGLDDDAGKYRCVGVVIDVGTHDGKKKGKLIGDGGIFGSTHAVATGCYYLSTATPGNWFPGATTWSPSDWKVSVAQGLGYSFGSGEFAGKPACRVDLSIHVKQEEEEHHKYEVEVGDWNAGTYVVDKPIDIKSSYVVGGQTFYYCVLSDSSNGNTPLGLLTSVGDTLPSGNVVINVKTSGPWNYTAGVLVIGKWYYSDSSNNLVAAVGPGRKKMFGKAVATAYGFQIIVGWGGYGDLNGNLVPDTDYDPTAADGAFDPVPEHQHEKIFTDNTDTGAKMDVNGYIGPEIVSDGHMVITSVSARMQNSGTDGTGYVIIDCKDGLGASYLDTVGQIDADAGAAGDIVTGSADLGTNQQCVMDRSDFPIAPGEVFYVSGIPSEAYDTYGFGLSIVVKYYYVKS